MNKKDLQVKKIWDSGVKDPRIIGQKLGYQDEIEGRDRVLVVLVRLGLVNKRKGFSYGNKQGVNKK